MPTETSPLDAAVQAVAVHALPVFAVLLILVLAGVALIWRLGARYGLRREDSRWPPLAYVAGHLLLGFALIAGAAALFAEIAEELGDGEALGRLDLLFSDTLREHTSRGVLRVFAVVTHLGDPRLLVTVCVLVGVGLLWRRHWSLAAGWLLTNAGNGLLNQVLKGIFARTRPVHDHGLAAAKGFSFPSGHASGSLVVYGMLAYLLVRLLPPHWPPAARLAAVLLASAAAFTTGASRVFLQVHFATDVLAGFAAGLAWLVVGIGTLELARYRQAGRAGR